MGNKGSNTNTTNTGPNAAAMDAYLGLLGRAQGAASVPYMAYSGPEVAGVNTQQDTGITNVNNSANFAMPYVQQAGAYWNSAGSPLTSNDIQQYIDPFTSQVIGATQADFDAQNARQQSQVTGNAAAQGALGGDRVGVAQALTAEAQNRTQAPIIAGLRANAYTTAVQTAEQQKQMQGTAAAGLLNTGTSGQSAALQGAQMQIGAGTLEQQTQQAQYTQSMQDYYQAQGYPFQTAQWLAGITTGVGSQMGGTSSTQGPTPNPWSQALGVGLTAASVFLASGGRVKGFAAGGAPTAPWSGAPGWVPGFDITKGKGVPEPPKTQKADGLSSDQLKGVGNIAKAGKDWWNSPGSPMDISAPGISSGDVGGSWGGIEGGTGLSGFGGFYDGGGAVMAGLGSGSVMPGYASGGSPIVDDFEDLGLPREVKTERVYRPDSFSDRFDAAPDEVLSDRAKEKRNEFRDLVSTASNPDWDAQIDRSRVVNEPVGVGTQYAERPLSEPPPTQVAGLEAPPPLAGPGVNDSIAAPAREALAYAPPPSAQPGNPLANMRPPGPAQGSEEGPAPAGLSSPALRAAPIQVPPPEAYAGVAPRTAQATEGGKSFLQGLGIKMSPELRQGLMAAGLSMMANRHGGPGSFLAAAGEGGMAGVGTYANATEKTAQHALEQQKLQQADKLENLKLQQAKWLHQTMTPYQQEQLKQKQVEDAIRMRTPIKMGETLSGMPIMALPRMGQNGEIQLHRVNSDGSVDANPMKPGAGSASNPDSAGTSTGTGAPPIEVRSQKPVASAEARDEEYLDKIRKEDPRYAETIKSLAEYTANPNNISVRDKRRERVLADVGLYDPTYDSRRYNSTNAAIKAFGTGPQGNQVRSFNVGIEHLGTAEELGKALENGDNQLINSLKNKIKTTLGYEAAPNFETAKMIVADEIAKAVIGGQTAQGDREGLQHQLSVASSPAQLAGVISTFKHLMAGQVAGLKFQYENSTGLHNFENQLTPRTREELAKYRGDAKEHAPTTTTPTSVPSSGRKPVRSGVVNSGPNAGKTVTEYSDGTKEYK